MSRLQSRDCELRDARTAHPDRAVGLESYVSHNRLPLAVQQHLLCGEAVTRAGARKCSFLSPLSESAEGAATVGRGHETVVGAGSALRSHPASPARSTLSSLSTLTAADTVTDEHTRHKQNCRTGERQKLSLRREKFRAPLWPNSTANTTLRN